MDTLQSIRITDVLSSAITPTTLITGVAFLTSIMAPRFGRCIDRIRGILAQLSTLSAGDPEYENHSQQLRILFHRTKILRNTMTAGGVCILFVVLTIIATFSNLIFHAPGPITVLCLFLASLLWLVLLTIGFTYDFLKSLNAVNLEIRHSMKLSKGGTSRTEAPPSVISVS